MESRSGKEKNKGMENIMARELTKEEIIDLVFPNTTENPPFCSAKIVDGSIVCPEAVECRECLSRWLG